MRIWAEFALWGGYRAAPNPAASTDGRRHGARTGDSTYSDGSGHGATRQRRIGHHAFTCSASETNPGAEPNLLHHRQLASDRNLDRQNRHFLARLRWRQ